MSSLWGVGSLFPPLDSLAALFVLVEAGFGGALSPPVSGRAHVVPPHVGPRGNGKDDDNQRGTDHGLGGGRVQVTGGGFGRATNPSQRDMNFTPGRG